jgi:hypothetical protein
MGALLDRTSPKLSRGYFCFLSEFKGYSITLFLVVHYALWRTIEAIASPIPKVQSLGAVTGARRRSLSTVHCFSESIMSSKPGQSAESNPAVACCSNAWREAYQSALDRGRKRMDAMRNAGTAYFDALPPLVGVRNIRNYIACVAHASAMGLIEGPDASRLLYAAKVAFSTRRIRSPKPQNARPMSKKRRPEAISEPEKAIQEPISVLAPPAQVSPAESLAPTAPGDLPAMPSAPAPGPPTFAM